MVWHGKRKIYILETGVNRKIKNGHIGVAGLARQWYCGHIVSTVSVSGKSVNYSALGDGAGTREDVQIVVFRAGVPDCYGDDHVMRWNVKQKTCVNISGVFMKEATITDTSVVIVSGNKDRLTCELTASGIQLEYKPDLSVALEFELKSITI